MTYRGFKLYARSSFWEGFARLLDLAGTLNEYNYSPSPERADFVAMRSDWEFVGSDILTAMRKFDAAFQG